MQSDESPLLEQLFEQVESLGNCLEEKQRDLEMAATLGASLVEDNKKLESEKEAMKAFYDRKLQAAEDENQLLAHKVESLADELALKESLLSKGSDCAVSLKDDNLALAEELEKSKLSLDQLSLLKSKLADNDKIFETLQNENCELKNQNFQQKLELLNSIDFVSALEKKLTDEKVVLKSELEAEKDRNSKLLEMLEENHSLKEELHDQNLKVDQMSVELEFLRESNQKLTSQLSSGSNGISETDSGGKTLLSEIEDRRLELIKQHDMLAEKHAGLAQTHSISLYRQQKMQHHIARLSQLTNTDASQEKVRLLEQSLSQCQSEKEELEKRLNDLETRQSTMISRWQEADLETDDSADQYRADALEFRIQQLIEEIEKSKTENQKIRLIKAGETDKLHHMTKELLDKDRELDVVKRSLANTKFELDELLLSLKEREQLSGLDPVLSATITTTSNIPVPEIDSQDLESSKMKKAESHEMSFPGNFKENLEPKNRHEMKPVKTMPSNNNPKIIRLDRNRVEKDDCKQQ